MSKEFLVSRQKASKILGVSTRTIDRYIAKEKFSIVREEGKVFLDSRELEEFKVGKNPVVAQMVQHSLSSLDKEEEKEEKKYKILYEASKEEGEKKDEMLRKMHYKLGILETEAKQSVPLLEAETLQIQVQELQDTMASIDEMEEENSRLKLYLHSAKTGRIFFFVLSLFFLLLILGIFILQNGRLIET